MADETYCYFCCRTGRNFNDGYPCVCSYGQAWVEEMRERRRLEQAVAVAPAPKTVVLNVSVPPKPKPLRNLLV